MSAAAGLSCTEQIVHIELKRLGAWPGLVPCRFCHRNHREKFDLWKCGGIAGLIGIVEAQLNALGWSWRRGRAGYHRSTSIDFEYRISRECFVHGQTYESYIIPKS
ncbi:hypothetical protein K438DRAFT_1774103 [Mycena galopus ATCC 62051]|nr:hypothetical protein K438DRAFT_1774103 [Mycena galopus ATCC 62051]